VKVLYKPFAIVVGIVAGILSKKAFDKVWGAFAEENPPDADDRDATWMQVIVGAAVSGAIIKVVQALVRRGGAKGFERATGFWPGDEARG